MGLVLGAVAAVSVLPGTGCGSGGASLMGPIARAGVFALDLGDLYFEVSPMGARITDVHARGGVNLLSLASVNPTNYGSTFWTSPQSAWGWPPPIPIDTAPYTATVASAAVSFVGAASDALGASVSKRFTADLAHSHVVATYSILAGSAERMFAPWEITRVLPGGLTFYPTGTGAPAAGGGFALLPTQDAAGCTWYQHPGVAPGANQKLLADGSGGWLAHVEGDTVLVKKFPDVPAGQAAPGEAEIEIFVDGQGAYVEVEEQGAYQQVAAGHGLDWTVTWIVSRLPAGLPAVPGSPELVRFVQGLVR